MRRREFITLLGGAAAAWPLAAHAQQPAKVPRIGFLHYGSPGPSPEVDAFRQGLRDLGYIEGKNINIEYRFASGRVERLPELAAELVHLKPDVIVSPTTAGSLAAKQATGTIPIVIAGVADAVGAGLVASIARPGGNVTGLTSISAELGGKRLELVKGIVPTASRVAVLHDPADRSNVLLLKGLQEAAPALGLTLQPLEVRELGEFEGAFIAISRERADALFGAPGVLTFEHQKTVVGLAAKSRIPTLWGHRQFVDVGGLMSYAVNFYDQCRRAATYVDQILKGAKPGDLPVQQPTKFEFILNLKTAKALGIDDSTDAARPRRRGDRMMKRREFITLLSGAAAIWPLGTLAQHGAKIPRIGVLMPGHAEGPDASRVMMNAIIEGLSDLGYTDGQNITFERRYGELNPDRLRLAAAELVERQVDLIVAQSTTAARSAKQATSLIPIVAIGMADPVEDELVASLARPGGNVTGTTFLGPELVAKRLQLLSEVVPQLSRVAVLWHPRVYGDRTMAGMLKEIESAARSLGIHIQLVPAAIPDDIADAFSAIIKESAAALIVFPSPMLFAEYPRIVSLASDNRLPAIYAAREGAAAGGTHVLRCELARLVPADSHIRAQNS